MPSSYNIVRLPRPPRELSENECCFIVMQLCRSRSSRFGLKVSEARIAGQSWRAILAEITDTELRENEVRALRHLVVGR